MNKTDSDADAPHVSEPVVIGARSVLKNESSYTKNKKDDDGKDGVATLHDYLESMKEDDEDATEADVQKLRDMLSGSYKTYVSTKGKDESTALHIVARQGLTWAAKMLIDAGASISIQDEDERQPLHQACFCGKRNVAELLINNGADINARHDQGGTPLDDACWKGHTNTVALLIEYGADTDALDNNGMSPLHTAAQYGSEGAVQLLLQKSKSRLDFVQPGWDMTPLHAATRHGHEATVDVLLQEGADTEIRDNLGWWPLYTATRYGYTGIVELLLNRNKSSLNSRQPEYDWTPLHVAAYNGHEEIVSILLKEGAKLDILDNEDWTPLMAATREKSEQVMHTLLHPPGEHEDLQLERRDNSEKTPLIRAIEDGFLSGVRVLIEAGADCNTRSEGGATALITASSRRDRHIVSALLQSTKPAEVDAKDELGRTALHSAILSGHAKVVELLLKHNADVMVEDNNGQQALHLASKQGNEAVVKMLLKTKAGKQLDVSDHNGMTPLHVASAAGDDDVLRQSPDEVQPDDGLTDAERKSPEFMSGRHYAIVKILLDRGAKLQARTKTGKKALHLAAECGNEEKVQAILEHMRDPFNPTLKVVDTTPLSDSEPVSEDLEDLHWAASNDKWHYIATFFITKVRKDAASSAPDTSKDWGAIEWAAYVGLSKVLWHLIASSPRTKATNEALKSAENIIKGSVGRSQISFAEQGKTSDDESQLTTETQRQDLSDIIRDPPIALMYKDSRTYEQPSFNRELYTVLGDFEAAVIQFRKGPGQFGSLRRFRSVREVIYENGPEGIMDDAVQIVKGFFVPGPENKETEPTSSTQPKTFMDFKPRFTWVHLPSTNMEWMNDLLRRIMKDEKYDASQFNQVRSFLRDSWVEVPDRISASRIMRPRFVMRDQETNADDEKDKTVGKDAGNSTAKQVGSKTSDRSKEEKDAIRNEEVVEKEEKSSEKVKEMKQESAKKCHEEDDEGGSAQTSKRSPSTTRTSQGQKDANLEQLKEERTKYQDLLKRYNGLVIHGSSTLDEWYYHFASDYESTRDKRSRNRSQVVTKGLPEGTMKHTHWPLIRVNQLWVWTLADKWLITASPHPIDGRKTNLLQEILEHLDKQMEAGGSSSQPDSTTEMSKLIVEYCIGSYERRPKVPEHATPDALPEGLLSIRQMFSNSINTIGRNETNLFEQFNLQTKEWRDKIQGKASKDKKPSRDEIEDKTKERSRGDGSLEARYKMGNKQGKKKETSPDGELREAIKKAESLSSNIKDIRDELNILKATAQYQRDVQDGMNMGRVQRAALSAAHIVNDIKEMDNAADRIQAAVNTTLSLQQSEVANLQAALSVEQGREAMKQGRTLMVFTVVTILFLPLSFLTSLFALDVASFLEAPGWALGVIFSVSIAFFVPLATYAVYSEKISEFRADPRGFVQDLVGSNSGTKSDATAGETSSVSLQNAETRSKPTGRRRNHGDGLPRQLNHSLEQNQLEGPSTHQSLSRKLPDEEAAC